MAHHVGLLGFPANRPERGSGREADATVSVNWGFLFVGVLVMRALIVSGVYINYGP